MKLPKKISITRPLNILISKIKDSFFRYWSLKMVNKSQYYQGEFKPQNLGKCLNVKTGKLPYARSSYEFRFFNWCDLNENITAWGSEIIEIPYLLESDQKLHRYYPDVYMELKDKTGIIKKYLIEIKPKKKLEVPKQPKRKTRKALENYTYLIGEYVMNQSKWNQARKYCEMRNILFRIVTEDQLFNNK
jgi:hypothetical protein